MKNISVILIGLFFSFNTFLLHAQSEKNRLTILNKMVDFGNVKSDTILVAKFFFVNSGTQAVEIEYVNPDCTCTNYKLSSKTVNPGDTAYVELQVNTTGKYGRNRIYATMKANTFVKMYKLTIAFTVIEPPLGVASFDASRRYVFH